MHGMSRYKHIERGKNISHLTRVNSSSNSTSNTEGARPVLSDWGLLGYLFRCASDSANMPAFKRVLESGLTMIAVHPIINTKLNEEGLPSLDYRISAD